MCYTLLQDYACGHTKPVCTTACPYAAATSSTNPFQDTRSSTPNSATFHHTVSPSSTTHLSPTTPNHQHGNPPSPPHPYSEDQGNDIASTANFCPYFFPRHLAPSHHPCLKCYMLPQWTAYRQRWINDYRVLHPGTPRQDLARMAGVEQIPGRVGLVNVIQEMDRLGVVREGGEGESRG